MEIRKISDNDKPNYQKLVKEHGTIFNSLDWLEIFGRNVEVYGIYSGGNKLIGGFSLYSERKFLFKYFRNPPFTPHIGPFARVESRKHSGILHAWKRILGSMADYIESLPCSIVSFALNRNIVDTQPFIWREYKALVRYTYTIDLEKPQDIIWKEMSAKRRNDITRGYKDGLSVVPVSDAVVVRELVAKTYYRQRLKVDWNIINRILYKFSNDRNSYAFATYSDGKPIAASFYVYDSNTVYQLLAGYDVENSHRGGEAMCVWEAIKHAQELGLKCFDFEGSSIPEIERFYRDFGGRLVPFYRVCKAHLPLEIILKFFKRELF